MESNYNHIKRNDGSMAFPLFYSSALHTAMVVFIVLFSPPVHLVQSDLPVFMVNLDSPFEGGGAASAPAGYEEALHPNEVPSSGQHQAISSQRAKDDSPPAVPLSAVPSLQREVTKNEPYVVVDDKRQVNQKPATVVKEKPESSLGAAAPAKAEKAQEPKEPLKAAVTLKEETVSLPPAPAKPPVVEMKAEQTPAIEIAADKIPQDASPSPAASKESPADLSKRPAQAALKAEPAKKAVAPNEVPARSAERAVTRAVPKAPPAPKVTVKGAFPPDKEGNLIEKKSPLPVEVPGNAPVAKEPPAQKIPAAVPAPAATIEPETIEPVQMALSKGITFAAEKPVPVSPAEKGAVQQKIPPHSEPPKAVPEKSAAPVASSVVTDDRSKSASIKYTVESEKHPGAAAHDSARKEKKNEAPLPPVKESQVAKTEVKAPAAKQSAEVHSSSRPGTGQNETSGAAEKKTSLPQTKVATSTKPGGGLHPAAPDAVKTQGGSLPKVAPVTGEGSPGKTGSMSAGHDDTVKLNVSGGLHKSLPALAGLFPSAKIHPDAPGAVPGQTPITTGSPRNAGSQAGGSNSPQTGTTVAGAAGPPVPAGNGAASPHANGKAQEFIKSPDKVGTKALSPVMPEVKGIVMSEAPIPGDLKLEITTEGGIAKKLKITALYKEYPKNRRGRPMSRAEARRIKKIEPKIIARGDNRVVVVIEAAGEGIYDLIGESDGSPVKTNLLLKLYENSPTELIKPLKTVTVKDRILLTRLLMPEGVLWSDDASFTGNMEDSESVTKFNTDSGLIWKEYKE